MDTSVKGGPGFADHVPFHVACARIDDTIRRMERLGVKTFNGNPKPKSDKNRFSVLDSESDSPIQEEGADKIEQDAFDDDEDHGEFTPVVRKRKNDSNTIGPHRVYTREECQVFSGLYNLWFKCLTGKDIGFVITPSSQPYVSAFEACMLLHHVLATLFDQRPNWVDPFGGSGGDTCAALFNLFPRHVFISEYDFSRGEGSKSEEFLAMENNINGMRRAFDILNPDVNPEAPSVHTYNQKSEDFLRELDPDLHIDILYLDPNWYKGGPLQETERSPKEMVSYLKYHIMRPLEGRKHPPKCIVLKTRWLSQVLWPFMKILTPDYHPMYSIEATPFREKIDEQKFKEEGEIRGRFHWAVIVHNELKTLHWAKSDVYQDLFLKRKDVFIEESDLISPRIPAYTGLIPYPKRSKRTSGEGLIHIHPPKRVMDQTHKPRHHDSHMSHFKKESRR